MTFSYLTALRDSIRASSAVMALVDGQVEMNLAVEQLESHLHGPNQSCINLSMAAWNGESIGIQALFNVEIRSRISQEYTYQIADGVRDLIEHGFSQTYSGTIFRVYVAKVLAETSKGETPRTYRVTQTVMGSLTQINTHDTVPAISSLTLSPPSPQNLTTGLKIKLACTASDLDGDPILYKFEHSGPATGGAWIALSVWQENNDTDWRPGRADVGTNYFRVKVIDGYHAGRGSSDAILASEAFVIADNALPVLSSLASSLASPQVTGTALKFIANASDEDGDWILYRFWLSGPSTGGVWEDQTGWISRNSWSWTPGSDDVGSNQIKVQIIDQKHAGRSSYDAALTISYTVTGGVLPVIEDVSINPIASQVLERPVLITIDAYDANGDGLFYKVIQIPPRTLNTLTKVADTTSGYVYMVAAFENGICLAAAGFNCLWRSTDYGLTWTNLGPVAAADSIDHIAVFPGTGIAILTGMDLEGYPIVCRSTDYGLTWAKVYTAPDAYECIRAPTTHSSGHAFADMFGIIIRTTDFGLTWSVVHTSSEEYIAGFVIFDNGFILAGHATIYRSIDWGASWTTSSASTEVGGNAEALDGLSATGYALVGNDAGQIYVTRDYGVSFTLLSTVLSGPNTIESIELQSNGIAVCVIEHTIYVSYDLGATFSVFYTFNSNTSLGYMAFGFTDLYPNYLLVPVCEPGITVAKIYRIDMTGRLPVDLTGWRGANNCTWTPRLIDAGYNVLRVLIRDGKHAGPGSYDALLDVSYQIKATAPVIIELYSVLASPQVAERDIEFICDAEDTENTDKELHYKFWHSGPNTVGCWKSMTGWQTQNYWTWKATLDDTGTNYIKVDIRNGKLAGPGSYDATTTVTFVITS